MTPQFPPVDACYTCPACGRCASNCRCARRWRKSSYSANNGYCVEVWPLAAVPAVLVRDSKDPDGPVLEFTAAQWRAFTERVKRS